MYDKKDKIENFYTDNYYALKSNIVLFHDYSTCNIKKDVKILIIVRIQAKECYDTFII